jgi:DNA (cytosine-5)-methyltransferase 1
VKHIDVFSGIGGFALAARKQFPKYGTIAFVEWDPFCQAVLAKQFTGVPIYGDISTYHYTQKDKVDLLTGGFPCQPFSHAGKRKGTKDSRYLWPQMLRVIHESKPRWIVAENVPGLLTIESGVVFEKIFSQLEDEGYTVWPPGIPACAVGAPHLRNRVWIVANRRDQRARRGDRWQSQVQGDERSSQGLPTPESGEPGGDAHRFPGDEDWVQAAARLCTPNDGLPGGLARPGGWRNAAFKAAGNSIVPQVAEVIFRAIAAVDERDEPEDNIKGDNQNR